MSQRNWEGTIREIDGEQSAGSCLYVAEAQDVGIVGLAYGRPAESAGTIGDVASLYVCVTYQGRGLGRKLLQIVAKTLAEKGMSSLQISVLEASDPERRFYEAMGGTIIDQAEGEDGPETIYGWPDIRMLFSGEL